MAEKTGNIIIDVLLDAGLQLNQRDLNSLEKRLRAAGAALSDGASDGLEDIRKQAEEVDKLLRNFNRRRPFLQQVATGEIDGSKLNKRTRAKLEKGFSEAAVLDRELGNLLTHMKSLAKGNGDLFFNEVKSMEAVRKQITSISGALGGLVGGVKAEREANLKAERIRLRKERADAHRESLARNNDLRSRELKQGKKLFNKVLRSDPTALDNRADAQEALKYARVAAKYRKDYADALAQRPGMANSKEVRLANQQTERFYDTVGALSARVRDLSELESLKKRDDAKARRIAKAEADYADGRAVRSAKGRNGLQALLENGGFTGHASKFESLDKLGRAMKFVNGELTASQSLFKVLRNELGETHPRVGKLGSSIQRMGHLLADMDEHESYLKRVERDRKDLNKQAAADQKELDKWFAGREELDRKRGLGTAPLTPLEEYAAARNKGREVRAAKAIAELDKQQAADQQKLDQWFERRAKLESQRTLGTAPLTPLQEFDLAIVKGQEVRAAAQVGLNSNVAKVDRKLVSERNRNTENYRLFNQSLQDPNSLATVRDVSRALAAGKVELSGLLSKQEAFLKASQGGTEEYRELTAQIKRAEDALDALHRRQTSLQDEAEKRRLERRSNRSAIYTHGRSVFDANVGSEGGLEALADEDYRQAKSYAQAKLREARQAYDALHASGKATSDQMRKAGDNVLFFEDGLNRLGMSAEVTAGKMDYMTNVLKMFVKYAIVYQGLYATLAAATSLASNVVNLQTELLEIQAVTGSTVGEMEKLQSVVTAVAQRSKFSLDELTKATKTLAQAGVPLADLNTALEATANFAAATGSTLETSADIVSTMRDVFKELNDDVIANQLAKAINISKLTGEGLRTILSLGAQTAKDFGISSEQFLAATASLRNAGLKDSTAATGLRQAMLEIFTPDNTLTKALLARYKELGDSIGSQGAEAVRQRFMSFTQASNPLVAALTELKRLGFSDEGQMLLTRAFDIRSSNAIRAMIANLEELSQYESEITFGRAAADGARVTIDGLNASWTRLMSTITSFTYNRSEGILGFLTDVIQGLDTAIQRWERYDALQDANQGLSPTELVTQRRAGLDTGQAPQAEGFWQNFLDIGRAALRGDGVLYDLRDVERLVNPGSQAEQARANIRGTDQGINLSQAQRETFNKEAEQWDLERARAGNAAGTGASLIIRAADTAAILSNTLTEGFGPEMAQQEKALLELLASYQSLTGTQRKVREQELRKLFPTLNSLDAGEFDRAVTAMASVGAEVQGAMRGMLISLQKEITDASIQVRTMAGRRPETADEYAAVAMLELHRADAELQAILEGNSKLSFQAQIEVVERFSQALSERIREKGGVLSDEALITQEVTNLRNKAKLLATAADQPAAQAEFRSEVSRVISARKDSEEATLEYLKLIRQVLLFTADEFKGGAEAFLKTALKQVDTSIANTGESVLKATARRVSELQERVIPLLQDPNFKESVNARPDTDPNKKPLLALIARPPTEEDAQGNSARFKLASEETLGYQTREKQQRDLKDRLDEEYAERYALENARGDARTEYNEAAQRNQFAKARAAKTTEAAYALQILQEQYDKAEQRYNQNVIRQDTTGIEENAKLIEELAALRNEMKLVRNDAGKAIQQLNQEELRVNNRRDTNAAKGEQSRLQGILSAASVDTPMSVIEETIQAYDLNQAELWRLLEDRKILEGDLSDESRAELEEAQRKLLKYKEQNDYLDLLQRQETEIRRRINDDLNKPISTGDTTEDARLNSLGVVPGSRTDRSYYLAMQAALLNDAVQSANKQVDLNKLTLERANAFLNDPATTTNTPGYDQQVKNQAEASQRIHDLNIEIDGYKIRIGEVRNELNNVRMDFAGALDQAFDLDTIILGLEQAESGVERLAGKIHAALIAGIEGVGDAFADALLEGEDFFESLDKLFLDTGKEIVRAAIKTYTTETITGFLKGFSDKAKTDAGTANPVGNPVGGGILKLGGDLLNKGWNWLTGKGDAPAANPNLPAGIPTDEAPPGGVLVSAVGEAFGSGEGGGGGGEGMCCGGDPADKVKDVVGTGDIFADAAEGESKGFFASLLSGFNGIWDTLKGGFGKAVEGLGGLLGIGGTGGALGMFASMIPGFRSGGIIRAATGGVIVGRGSGTSDSVPGFIRSRNGKLVPLLTSNGESILTAKATQMLGADTIHALNSGRYTQANTSRMVAESQRMMKGMQAGGAANSQSGFVGGPSKTINSTQVNVSPAHMRMRMGDWLEQHVLEELSKR